MKTLLLLLAFAAQTPPKVAVISVTQSKADWEIVLKANNVLDIDDIDLTLEGHVSNSAAENHAIPRLSRLDNHGYNEFDKFSNSYRTPRKCLLEADREESKCWEHMEYRLADEKTLVVTVAHRHQMCEYSPLLGERSLTLKTKDGVWTGKARLKAEEIGTKYARWVKSDATRLADRSEEDGAVWFDSSEPGKGYFRYDEVRVRPGSRVRVKFKYLILKYTDGYFNFRFSEYEEYGGGWKAGELYNFTLEAAGEWRTFEKVIVVSPKANNTAMEFSLRESEFGRAWVKDLVFEPIEGFQVTRP